MAEAAVILAAGAGTRLGGVAKALLADGSSEHPSVPPHRRTFLARIVATARGAGATELVVVVGPPHREAVAAHARELHCRVADNPAPERGMASSVAIGFAALADSPCDAAWLWPVDHPAVAPATLLALKAARGAHAVARPTYEGRGGHPPLVGRSLWSALAGCAGVDGGARTVLAAADMLHVPVDDAGVVRDVDTPADREALR